MSVQASFSFLFTNEKRQVVEVGPKKGNENSWILTDLSLVHLTYIMYIHTIAQYAGSECLLYCDSSAAGVANELYAGELHEDESVHGTLSCVRVYRRQSTTSAAQWRTCCCSSRGVDRTTSPTTTSSRTTTTASSAGRCYSASWSSSRQRSRSPSCVDCFTAPVTWPKSAPDVILFHGIRVQ